MRQCALVGPGGPRVRWLDPRAQLGWLLAAVLGALFGGDPGLLGAALLAGSLLLAGRAVRPWLRLLVALLPLALLVAALDGLAGQPARGARVGARLVVLASLGFAFARTANAEALMAGLQALRVPYPLVFVLVAGARFVPTAAADLATLRDAARLRGVALDGPPWRQVAGWRRLLVPLLVGTVRRGLQLGEAMEARAFGARPRRTTRHRVRWRGRDTAALLAAAAYLGLLALRWT